MFMSFGSGLTTAYAAYIIEKYKKKQDAKQERSPKKDDNERTA
jgi:hypothetical protein